MAPKRKAASVSTGTPKKKEKPEAEDDFHSTIEALKAAPKETQKARVDSMCPLSSNPIVQVYEDYDCTLNQTNIGSNNNKFYLIQLLDENGRYGCWNRWGRVGEKGQSKLSFFPSLDEAKRDFEKKFWEKTKNHWTDRDNFVAHSGKYTLIEVQADDGEKGQEGTVKIDHVDGVQAGQWNVKPCTLDPATQELVSLIFSHDMFNDAMKTMNLDVKKMPLGKLSKQQIAKGFEALEALESALQKSSEAKQLEELSSRFYTIIPHNFGRKRPPPINSLEVLQAKKDMLLVLADIELAQALKAGQEEEENIKVGEVPHPLDRDYELLRCQLQPLATDTHEYKLIETYLKKTGWPHLRILHVWKTNREGEGERFRDHAKLENRRLLWHGTNVAVVAAILKSGLRIMPHSGGRVGQGIYFASENSKSACYVGCTSQKIGLMFLSEVALGQEYHITKDDCSLRQPPPGYHSIVARGHTEPDPRQDVVLELEGQKVMVPQGPPMPMPDFQESSFFQSEYLIYKESQCRLRYLLQLHF
ncbi:protein mono-ADP-ribosyltransferase PARP3 [Trichosurus vulpecula]|uniref:protein mono-ADP-ribosyltransferase PARP3 n=1 Tax=Trichosurus vulpecula TaxID=9337 RepID=UPI00186AE3A9|nr:protein mono-ADP-ribosyltransferase PARP3 [Trichosurus vulpecula]XP_036594430.1 protein mono-ADP-ribosyltransferase PARP3 [Trichosurus vulpecula]XP_036594431.1 protein mono-ADP-ribosyltransferase PARP3 [Trichosurus vulpecula]